MKTITSPGNDPDVAPAGYSRARGPWLNRLDDASPIRWGTSMHGTHLAAPGPVLAGLVPYRPSQGRMGYLNGLRFVQGFGFVKGLEIVKGLGFG